MDWNLELTMAMRALFAALLGVLIGWERRGHGSDAGLRTYAAVSLGACVFGLVSTHAGPDTDTTRIASNVVTGVGFLCAGVILRERGRTVGLTTAATLWATAAVGLALAFGMYVLGVLSAVLIFVLLAIHHLPLWARLEGRTAMRQEEAPPVPPPPSARRLGIVLLAGLASLFAAKAAPAAPLGSQPANEAIERCREADWLVGSERAHLLATGMTLAEEAIHANDNDAAAHFALFCNLGKQLQAGGVNPWVFSDVKRLHREIDRAIALAPRDTELWVAKGALLMNLPSFLGGDEIEAERWLVAAFVVDPDNRSIRAYLYQVYK